MHAATHVATDSQTRFIFIVRGAWVGDVFIRQMIHVSDSDLGERNSIPNFNTQNGIRWK